MGLAILPHLASITAGRKAVFQAYHALLPKDLITPFYNLENFEYNYSYFPVIFESEEMMLRVQDALKNGGVIARRYFYPSLNVLPFVGTSKTSCPVSEEISIKVLCLPLYHDLQESEIRMICSTIKKSLEVRKGLATPARHP
jgi:dTDP-4-amino-4,6-dideoxygalactose transaminase